MDQKSINDQLLFFIIKDLYSSEVNDSYITNLILNNLNHLEMPAKDAEHRTDLNKPFSKNEIDQSIVEKPQNPMVCPLSSRRNSQPKCTELHCLVYPEALQTGGITPNNVTSFNICTT